MNEDQIASEQLQKVQDTSYKSPTPEAPSVMTNEQSSIDPPKLNELIMLRIASRLNIDRPQGKVNDYVAYIYEEVMSEVGTVEQDVMDRIDNYLLELGISFQPDRLLRLYNWMKLNTEKRLIEQEMKRNVS